MNTYSPQRKDVNFKDTYYIYHANLSINISALNESQLMV